MSRHLRKVVAAAAGCLLLASCAIERSIPDSALEYVPVPVSKLVSRPDLQFKVATVEGTGRRTATLAYQPPGEVASPVAVVQFSRSGDEHGVSIRRLPLKPATLPVGDLNLATLEHLYALMLRQDPEAKFCLSASDQTCDVVKDGRSHAELLRELATARQQALASSSTFRSSVPWQVVSMVPAKPRGTDADDVAVRIGTADTTMQGMSVIFNRAPHSGCVAKSLEDGVAACHLVDQHGDDDADDHDHASVFATFPGDVRSDRILLPTTTIVRPKS